MILSEPRLSIVTGSGTGAADRGKTMQVRAKRRFWLGFVAVFGLFGIMSGSLAMVLALLTACAVLREGKGSSIFVSALLLGCLGALLLAAHGMDRVAALHWEKKV